MRTMMVPGRVAVIPGGVGIDRPLDRPVGCPHGDPGGAHAAARCGFDFDRDTRNSKATGQTREPLAGRTGVHQRAKEHVAADTRHGVDDGERMAGHGLEYHPLLWWRQFGRITIEPPRARIEKDDSLLRSQHTSFPEQPGRRDRSTAFRREINTLEPATFARPPGAGLVVDHPPAHPPPARLPPPPPRARPSSSPTPAPPPLSRSARSMSRSPSGPGTRRPLAMVQGSGHGSQWSAPDSNAFTTGAQPWAWTVNILGNLPSTHPAAPSSWKAFHIPMRPVPPPVGYRIACGSVQPKLSATSRPRVFFPSIRYGSRRVERSKAPVSAA